MRDELARFLTIGALAAGGAVGAAAGCSVGVPGSSITDGNVTFGSATESAGTDSNSAGDTLIDPSIGESLSSGAGESTSNPGESTNADGATSGNPPTCGDDIVEGDEVCDGTALGGEDCPSQGFDGGTLGCAADCSDYDTRACTLISCGDEMLEGNEVCDGADLGGADCASEGFVSGPLGCLANCMGFDTTGCVACGNAVIDMGETCDGAQLNGQTCASQGFDAGVLSCTADCSGYDTGACTLSCVEQDIGSSLGASVAAGSTVGEDEDIAQSCGAGGAVDRVISFTAPAAATFRFDTFGSGYDTVLAAYSTCSAASEIVCNDDTGGLQSQIDVALPAGGSVLVTVSGYSGGTGNYVLNVTQL